ncbi:MAG TPA: hypothetical protein VFT43_03485 [Candidatus Polarisedimenticolia bacterium]|nr:hypothetical protein [Candidatus Polarisedimenticolia bacterium]
MRSSRIPSLRSTLLPAAAGLALLAWGGAPAGAGAADPGVSARLQARLEADRSGVRRYSYVESEVMEKRASDGTLRSSTSTAHEIFFQDGRWLKRPLAADLAQDSQGFALMRGEEARFLPRGGAAGSAARADKESPFSVEKILGCLHLEPEGRELLGARPALKVAFSALPGCLEDQNRATRIIENLSGTLWIDEADFDLVKVEGRLRQPVSFGWGLLGRVDSLDLTIDREPLAPGLYAMTRVDYRARGVSFIVHRFDVRSVRQRSAFARSPEPPVPPEPGAGAPSALLAPAPGSGRADRPLPR